MSVFFWVVLFCIFILASGVAGYLLSTNDKAKELAASVKDRFKKLPRKVSNPRIDSLQDQVNALIKGREITNHKAVQLEQRLRRLEAAMSTSGDNAHPVDDAAFEKAKESADRVQTWSNG